MAEMPAFGCANMSHSQNRASIAPPIESRLLDGCDSCDIDAIERNCMGHWTAGSWRSDY